MSMFIERLSLPKRPVKIRNRDIIKDQITNGRVLDEMFLTNSIMLKRIGGMVPLEFSISTRKYNQLFNNMGTVYFYNSIIYINIDKEFLPGIISLYTIVYRL